MLSIAFRDPKLKTRKEMKEVNVVLLFPFLQLSPPTYTPPLTPTHTQVLLGIKKTSLRLFFKVNY